MTKGSKDTDNTENQQLLPPRKKHSQLKPWKPGQSGNPKGRPLGARNKFAEQFVEDFLADWEVGGPSAIEAARLEDPTGYLRVAASLVPREFSMKDGKSDLDAILDHFNHEQLTQLYGLLESLESKEVNRREIATSVVRD